MTLDDNKKEQVFSLIDKFNNQPSNPEIKNSKSYLKEYLYVDSHIAEERAEFIGYLLNNNLLITQPAKVIDLAFGSGNLSAHILLDNNIEIEQAVFNDSNNDLANQSLDLGGISSIESYDFINAFPLKEKFDVVIFNPQIGGSHTRGESGLAQSIKTHFSDGPIDDYLKDELGVDFDFEINKDELNKKITISSQTTKKLMSDKLSSLKVWNYYDVFYKSGKGKIEGSQTNLVKFRNNITPILSEKHTLFFYGKLEHFNTLFADYERVWRYMSADEGQDLFVIQRSDNLQYQCYERTEDSSSFVLNTEGKKTEKFTIIEDSLDNLFGGILTATADFSETVKTNPFGIKGSSQSELQKDVPTSSKKPSDNAKNNISKDNDKQPFKNFLLEYLNKEER